MHQNLRRKTKDAYEEKIIIKEVDNVDTTCRNDNGFGSSGIM